MKKKGAMELSIGTIVIIVLAMSMLIFGMILLKNIFEGATSVVDMTDEQLKDQIKNIFGEEERVVVYPSNRYIEVKQGEVDGFGIGIQNLLSGSSEDKFSYDVIVSDPDIRNKCGVSEKEAEAWLLTGYSEDNIPIPPGSFESFRVRMLIPEGTSLCTLRYRVNVRHGSESYGSREMDVTIKPA